MTFFRAPKSLTAINPCLDEMEELRKIYSICERLAYKRGLQKLSSKEY